MASFTRYLACVATGVLELVFQDILLVQAKLAIHRLTWMSILIVEGE